MASKEWQARVEMERLDALRHMDSAADSANKKKRSRATIASCLDMSTAQVQFALDCKVAFANVPKSLREAADLIGKFGVMDKSTAKLSALDNVLERYSIGRHCLVLDEAFDLFVSDTIQSRRGTTFFGAGMSSDESPPSQPRFRGFRFQVTYVYVPYIPAPSTWMRPEYIQKRPIENEEYLMDIMHCPGKDGRTTYDVISRQMGRIGLTPWDIVSGTGDGGGENEGKEGVHRIYEESGAGYVRKRCHGHLGYIPSIFF